MTRVPMTRLFATFLAAQEAAPEASLVYSLAASPPLGDFLAALDPAASLDWNGLSFQGLPSLRAKVVEALGYAPACGPEDVLITAGANEANALALTQLLAPGDEVLVDAPGWPQPLALAPALGVTARPVPRDESRGWALDLDALASALGPRTRMVFLCNPSNPTGAVTPEADLREVLRLADRVGARVVCDEVYRGLEWDGAPTPRAASLHPRAISTGSVSKSLGLQGIRTGWMVCRDPAVIRAGMALREQWSEVMNVLGERVADLALDPARYAPAVARARAEGARRLDALDAFLRGARGLSWQRPRGGLLGLVAVDPALGLDGDAFAARLLAPPYRTLVMSGAAYGRPHHVRVGVGGGPESRIEDGLARLEAMLRAL